MKESDLDDKLNRDLINFKVASKICDLESNWMKVHILSVVYPWTLLKFKWLIHHNREEKIIRYYFQVLTYSIHTNNAWSI